MTVEYLEDQVIDWCRRRLSGEINQAVYYLYFCLMHNTECSKCRKAAECFNDRKAIDDFIEKNFFLKKYFEKQILQDKFWSLTVMFPKDVQEIYDKLCRMRPSSDGYFGD